MVSSKKQVLRFHLKKIISSRGFTLIELLLVIVIIGILAAVVIGIINPVAQQNRAKDAVVKGAISKISLATQSFISAYGTVPLDTEFTAALNSATSYGATCTGGADYDCTFSVAGVAMPTVGCAAAASYAGNTGAQCYFRYTGVVATKFFTIYAKSWGLPTGVFKYTNDPASGGQVQQCIDGATPTGCVNP